MLVKGWSTISDSPRAITISSESDYLSEMQSSGRNPDLTTSLLDLCASPFPAARYICDMSGTFFVSLWKRIIVKMKINVLSTSFVFRNGYEINLNVLLNDDGKKMFAWPPRSIEGKFPLTKDEQAKLRIENHFLFISCLSFMRSFQSERTISRATSLRKKSPAFIMFPHKSLIYERFSIVFISRFNNP